MVPTSSGGARFRGCAVILPYAHSRHAHRSQNRLAARAWLRTLSELTLATLLCLAMACGSEPETEVHSEARTLTHAELLATEILRPHLVEQGSDLFLRIPTEEALRIVEGSEASGLVLASPSGASRGASAPSSVRIRLPWPSDPTRFRIALSELAARLRATKTLARHEGADDDTQEPLELDYAFDPLVDDFVLASFEVRIDSAGTLLRSRADATRPLRDNAEREPGERISEELERTRAALEPWIEASELGPSGKRALRDTLERATLPDWESGDEPKPSFIRALIQDGWLDRLTGNDPRAHPFATALLRASRWTHRDLWSDSQRELSEFTSELGDRVRVLRHHAGVRYHVSLPSPAYLDLARDMELVVDLALGDDPLESAPTPLSAHVYVESVQVASWNVEKGLVADPALWRKWVVQADEETDDDAGTAKTLAQAIPPHALIVAPGGDVLLLITEHGSLAPLQHTLPESVEEFLAEAARALPDAAHLDLLGEYLFAYVSDSPDPRFPELLGTVGRVGEFHQTIAETLSRVSAGRYRGDCDDLAELYQGIARLQGRNAHIMGLPGHAALGWVDARADGATTYVLQTGPPLAIEADTKERSLAQAYQHFAPDSTIDVDQLEIMLRFGRDSLRDSYAVSAAVFWDRTYADRIIALQEDWHEYRYGSALSAAQALVAEDPARVSHLLERASLESITGRSARAARSLAAARDRSSVPMQRAHLAIRELDAWLDAEEEEPSERLLREVMQRWPADTDLSTQPGRLELWMELASTLARPDRDPLRALEILAEHVRPELTGAPGWLRDSSISDSTEEFLRLSTRVLAQTRTMVEPEDPRWQALRRDIETWFELAAFRTADADENVLRIYGWLGHFLEATYGEPDYRDFVEAQRVPELEPREHRDRVSEERRARRDAQWVGISPYYWWGALRQSIDEAEDELPRAELMKLAYFTRRACIDAQRHQLERPIFEDYALQAALVVGLATGNVNEQRSSLEQIRARRDPDLLDTAAYWFAELGPYLSLEEFEQALGVASQELDAPRHLLRIAWRLAAAEEWDYATIAARRALRASRSAGSLDAARRTRREVEHLLAHERGREGDRPQAELDDAHTADQVEQIRPEQQAPLVADDLTPLRDRRDQ